jgi:ABC-type Fe3+ transport system permease subunit
LGFSFQPFDPGARFLLAARTHLLYNPVFGLILFRRPAFAHGDPALQYDPQDPRDRGQRFVMQIFQILLHIIFPLCRTGIATVVILNFIEIWNEYLFALVLLNQENRTLQLVIPLLRAERVTDYSIIAAGLIMAVLPVLGIFILFQERIMSGLYSGGVKG